METFHNEHCKVYRRIQMRKAANHGAHDARNNQYVGSMYADESYKYYAYVNAHEETRRTMERKLP